jgi:hypothetical protein
MGLRRAKVKGNSDAVSGGADLRRVHAAAGARKDADVRQTGADRGKTQQVARPQSRSTEKSLLPWDADQSLLTSPVTTGQRVMTVADPAEKWQLELAMPERRMGHIAERSTREVVRRKLDAGTG